MAKIGLVMAPILILMILVTYKISLSMGWITLILQILLQSVSQVHPDGQDGQDQAGAGSNVDLDEVGNLLDININVMNNLCFTNFTLNSIPRACRWLGYPSFTQCQLPCWPSWRSPPFRLLVLMTPMIPINVQMYLGRIFLVGFSGNCLQRLAGILS